MSLTSWQVDAEPKAKVLVLPPAAADLGEAEAAIELWEHYSLKRLDAAQRLVVQVLMAQDASGRWAASTTGREMPRQNGKGDEIEVVELWGLVQRGEAILHTVHDAVLLASQTQQRMLSVLEGHADLRKRLKRVWKGTGQQMIELQNGGVIWYRTRTGGGGRGVDDIDRLVVDEAQHATEEHLAAVSPTMLANDDPQLNAMGTAGLTGHSAWWWRQRRRALSADPGSFGWVGHTAETVTVDEDGRIVQEPVDVEDRSLWMAANPALASGRTSIDFLEEQLRRLGPESFAREHLGVWDPPPVEDGDRDTVVDMEHWHRLRDGAAERPSTVAFGVAVSPDRKWSTIAAAGARPDGGTFLAIVRSGRGTSWLVERLLELDKEWRPVGIAIDRTSAAGSLLPELSSRRVRRVVPMSTQEVAQACGLLVDGIEAETVRHDGSRLLEISLESVTWKRAGESRVWGPPADGSTDVSPLQAATIALHALTKMKPSGRGRTGGRRASIMT